MHQESITGPRDLSNVVREYSTFVESLNTSSGKPAGLSPFHKVAWSTFAERSEARFFSARGSAGAVGQIMKAAKECSRCGSDTCNQVYIYGGLNSLPTIMKRAFGMSWVLGGWRLAPMIREIGMEKFQGMRLRVAREIKTTFASSYAQEISLTEMLRPDVMRRCQARDVRKISGLPAQVDLKNRCPDAFPRPSDPRLPSSGYQSSPLGQLLSFPLSG